MPLPNFVMATGLKLQSGLVLDLAHHSALIYPDDGTNPGPWNKNTTPSGGTIYNMEGGRNFAALTQAEHLAGDTFTYYLKNGNKLVITRSAALNDNAQYTLQGSLYDPDNTLLIGTPAVSGNYKNWNCQRLLMCIDIANNRAFWGWTNTNTYVPNPSSTNPTTNASYNYNNVYDYFVGTFDGLPGPYDQGGTTEEGGGGGDFTTPDDTLPVPGFPSVDLADNGLFSIYNPDAADLVSLGNFLWTGLFDIDNFKKLFNDPMQAIISLGIIPGGSLSLSATDKNVIFGHVDTGVDCKTVTSQWLEVDCGFVEISEFWGNYLDYNPYTKLRLYLPYIGEIDLNADDVIGPYYNNTTKHIGVVYHIDVITGACVAFVTRGEGSGVGARNDVFYTATGNVLMQIPVSANDFKGAYSALIGIAGAAIAGGTAAAAVKGATAGTIGAGAAVAGTSAAISNVTSEKETVRHTGNMAGTAGLMGEQKPYIYIDRPNQAEPYNQRYYTGYPSLIQHDNIGELSGFTILYTVKLTGIHATAAELAEIERLLLEGVIL